MYMINNNGLEGVKVEVKWRAKSNLGQEMVTTMMRRRADV